MATNALFKADDYISVNVGLEKSSGDPFIVGALTGVLTTGSGSATTPVPDGKKQGVGNKPGWASVALYGGFRVTVPAGTYAVGDIIYITSGGTLTKTAGSNTRFGVVTHEPKTIASGTGTVVVKIGY
jgi:hypothetical protein